MLRPPGERVLQRKCACTSGTDCETCSAPGSSLQAKLAVGDPGDAYEREADRVAEQVLAAPSSVDVSSAPPRIQRLEGSTSGGVGEATPSVERVLASPGQSLEPTLRRDMEARFARDFSGVRVHVDDAAAQSARDVGARAYTVGSRIVFGAGEFVPGTESGRRLLAHELTHAVQQGSAAPALLQRKVDPAACIAQKDEILPPVGAVASIDREVTLSETLGAEYPPLRAAILKSSAARQLVCEAGVPAVLALWDTRTPAGALDVAAARAALAADTSKVYSQNLDASWLRRRRLGRAERELDDISSWARLEEKTQSIPQLLLPTLPKPQAANLLDAIRQLDAIVPDFEAAAPDLAAARTATVDLENQLGDARKDIIKSRNPDYASNARELLGKAQDSAAQLDQKLRSALRGFDVGELVKGATEISAAVGILARNPLQADPDTISELGKAVRALGKKISDVSQNLNDPGGAARRLSFALRYFAGLNVPGFDRTPDAKEAAKFAPTMDTFDSDLELVFGSNKSLSFGFLGEVAAQIRLQIEARRTMGAALKKEMPLVPSQVDALAYFKGLKGKSNKVVEAAYMEYATAFFAHRHVDRMNDFALSNLDEIFARPSSVSGTRPLVCSGFAFLGAQLLVAAGANPAPKFIVAIRASEEQRRRGQFDAGHAVAVVERKGAKLFVSNSAIVDKLEDAIGANAVAWRNKENPIFQATGSTVQAAIQALAAMLAQP